MLNQNYVQYIGLPLAKAEDAIRASFFGTVVVIAPGDPTTTDLRPSRLQIHIDDQGIITRIIHG